MPCFVGVSVSLFGTPIPLCPSPYGLTVFLDGEQGMKRSKLAIAAILIIVVAMVAPASAFITAQNIETKAERMVYIAYDAQETIMGIVTRVEINATAYDMLLAADLDEFFYANVSLCVADGTTLNKTEITVIGDGEAWILLDAANVSLYAGEYEDAIAVESMMIDGKEVRRAVVTPANCSGCGNCVSACPNRAVDVQGWTLAQYDAMIDAITLDIPQHEEVLA